MTDSFDKAVQYADELDEVIAPGALDDQLGKVIPLVAYSGGRRSVVGSAEVTIDGNALMIRAEIDNAQGADSEGIRILGSHEHYTAASFTFGRPNPEVVVIRGNIPGAIGKRV